MRARGALQECGSGGTKRFRGAENRTGIAGILDAIEHNDQGARADQLFERPFGRPDERDDALARFGGGEAVENSRGHGDDTSPLEPGKMGPRGLGDDHRVNLKPGGERFLKQMKTFGDGESGGGERSARDGLAHVLQKRIFFAGERFKHPCPSTRVHYNVGIMRLAFRIILIAAFAAGGVILVSLYSTARAIERQSTVDEARPADVILVLGAAEYRGKPSPVLEARLNHALWLYRQGMAPRILTTGGKGGDPTFTEGEVARAYLSKHNVPSEAILVESEGESTVHSTAAAAEIMHRMNLNSCIVVSDGYHIYRVKKMLEFQGMNVYGSPRPAESREEWKEQWLYFRQAVAYGLWRIGIPV